MTFLVVGGLDAWNEVMADVPEDGIPALVPSAENEYLEIEATGYQLAWDIETNLVSATKPHYAR